MQKYTIQEAVRELSISKGTLYNRINKFKQQLNSHIYNKNGRTYISAEGLEILKTRGHLDISLNSVDSNLDSLDNENKVDAEAFELLKNENFFLRNQLIEKDNQIQSLLRLNENNQILLKQQQELKMLPTPQENKLRRFFSKCFSIKK